MKILFFGLGSIGQRHASIIRNLWPEHELLAYRTHLGQKKIDKSCHNIIYIHDWKAVENHRPDIAFICNPTHKHIETAFLCAECGMHLFIEKPIGVTTDYLGTLLGTVAAKKLVTYVAYPLRHHPNVGQLRLDMAETKPLHAKFVCISYYPNWRPDIDYLKNYSAYREQGGGPLLDMSHQLDLATYLFGRIKEITGQCSKLSDVTVDADDCMDLIVKHESGVVTTIHVNYFSTTPPLDYLRVIGADCKSYIKSFYEMGQAYNNQLVYFFEQVEKQNTECMNNLQDASVMFEQMIKFRDKEAAMNVKFNLRADVITADCVDSWLDDRLRRRHDP